MSAFWALAGRDWPPKYPTHQLVDHIGSVALAALLATGVLHEEAIRPHDTVPCTACRRRAEVIYQRGRAFAICSGGKGCPDEDLGPAPSWASMNAEDFAIQLAATLGLDGAPGVGGDVVPLGERMIGDERVAVDLCPHPGEPQALDALARLARRGPEVRVVLVPDSRRLRADLSREVGGVEIVWAGLDEVLTMDGRIGADLAPILARRAFRGMAAAVPPAGLRIDASGVQWRGRTVVGPEKAQIVTLLRTLAARPCAVVSRRELWRVLWPLEHTRTGGLARGVNSDDFNARLHLVVKGVRAALAAAGAGDVVKNQLGNPDKGGYRLMLPPDQVSVA